MSKTYKVIAPLVLAKVSGGANGTVGYFYEPAFLPPNVDPDHLDHLIKMGLVEEVAAPTTPVEGDETGDGEVTPADSAKLPDGAPAKSAAKPVWVDFAVSKGVDRAEAEKATKEQLIEQFSQAA